MLQFDWLYDVCGYVMSPTLGIYWVDMSFINNYKEPQLWLVILRYSTDVASVFPWIVTIIFLMYVSRLKKNLSYFSLHLHTLSLCLLEANHFLSPPWLSPWRRQHFTLSSLVIFSKAATFCSLLFSFLFLFFLFST